MYGKNLYFREGLIDFAYVLQEKEIKKIINRKNTKDIFKSRKNLS